MGESNKLSGSVLENILTVVVKEFSSLPSENKVSMVMQYQLLIRKSAHFLVFAALGFSAVGFFATFPKIKRLFSALLALVYVALYAISDEVHQLFVLGRTGRVSDVVIDTAGGIFGIIVFFLAVRFLSWRLKRYETE